MKGCRPIATNTESKFSFSPSEKTNSLLSTLSIEVFNLNLPFLLIVFLILQMFSYLSQEEFLPPALAVTSESRSTSKLANSHPIAPAPTIQTFLVAHPSSMHYLINYEIIIKL